MVLRYWFALVFRYPRKVGFRNYGYQGYIHFSFDEIATHTVRDCPFRILLTCELGVSDKPGTVYVTCTPFNIITKTSLFKYNENFYDKKKCKFSDKNSDIFYIYVQNMDCGYSVEPTRRGSSNEYPQPMFSSRNKKNNVNASFII